MFSVGDVVMFKGQLRAGQVVGTYHTGSESLLYDLRIAWPPDDKYVGFNRVAHEAELELVFPKEPG